MKLIPFFIAAACSSVSALPHLRPSAATTLAAMVVSPPLRRPHLPGSTLRPAVLTQPDRLAREQKPLPIDLRQPQPAGIQLGAVTRARGLLLAAGAVWGTYPVVLRALYAAPGPALPPLFIVAARFATTAIMLAALQAVSDVRVRRGATAAVPPPRRTRRSATAVASAAIRPSHRPRALQQRRAAVELACIGVAGNFLSVWGLSRVAATLAETLLGCVHLFVPLLTVALGGARAVGVRTWQACGLSFLAVVVAAAGGARAAAAAGGAGSYSLGLAALVGSALLYALGRVRTQHHVGERKVDARALNRQRWAYKAALASGALLLDAWRLPLGGSRAILAHLGAVSRAQWLLVLTSCVTAGVVGSSLQFEAQKVLPAASMQPFFALQPLFACAWTRLFLAEPVAPAMLGGGALMVAGALLASTDARTVAE